MTISAVTRSQVKSMTLKMGFKVQMTSFVFKTCNLVTWLYITITASHRRSIQDVKNDSYYSESSGSENLSDIWNDNGEEKNPELNENFGVLFGFEPKAPIPSAESSSIWPGNIGLEEKVVEETTVRISNLDS